MLQAIAEKTSMPIRLMARLRPFERRVKINPTAIYMGTPEIKDNPIIVRAIVQALIDSKKLDFKILQVIQNNCSTRIEEYLEPFNTNNYIKALDSLILQQELEEKLSNDKPKAKTINH